MLENVESRTAIPCGAMPRNRGGASDSDEVPRKEMEQPSTTTIRKQGIEGRNLHRLASAISIGRPPDGFEIPTLSNCFPSPTPTNEIRSDDDEGV